MWLTNINKMYLSTTTTTFAKLSWILKRKIKLYESLHFNWNQKREVQNTNRVGHKIGREKAIRGMHSNIVEWLAGLSNSLVYEQLNQTFEHRVIFLQTTRLRDHAAPVPTEFHLHVFLKDIKKTGGY